ncbi:MAG TPA: hypothetical protein VLV90_11055 [Burkholderiales bacterium]|nr:hypothetical protein [Burkholderiales bacterium]
MGRMLRQGVVFTLLFAGLVAPAAADPLLLFLIGIARDMIVDHATDPNRNAEPVLPMPDFGKVYPGTSVEPEVLHKLIDDSFLYLSDRQRQEIFDQLNAALLNPRNAAVRGTMIEYFAEKALEVRAAQLQLAKMPYSEKQRMAAEFKTEIAGMDPGDQDQVRQLLRKGLLPVPSDLNQLLLAAVDGK